MVDELGTFLYNQNIKRLLCNIGFRAIGVRMSIIGEVIEVSPKLLLRKGTSDSFSIWLKRGSETPQVVTGSLVHLLPTQSRIAILLAQDIDRIIFYGFMATKFEHNKCLNRTKEECWHAGFQELQERFGFIPKYEIPKIETCAKYEELTKELLESKNEITFPSVEGLIRQLRKEFEERKK